MGKGRNRSVGMEKGEGKPDKLLGNSKLRVEEGRRTNMKVEKGKVRRNAIKEGESGGADKKGSG